MHNGVTAVLQRRPYNPPRSTINGAGGKSDDVSSASNSRTASSQWRRLAITLAALTCAVAIAACGSGSASTSSSSRRMTQAQLQQAALNFAHCMRAHGDPSFPDPTSPREFKFSLSPTSGGSTQSPAFQSAERACRHLLPRGGPDQTAEQPRAHLAAMLAFARCLRSHGFPNFPDPTANGELTRAMVAQAGINLHQPAVLHAGDACVGVTHGALTRADVARAVNNSTAAGG